MRKIVASIQKELQILWHDKVGLTLLFVMPIVLVFIITLVQDSAFKLVNENRLELMVSNADEGHLGDSLICLLEKSGSFDIERVDDLKEHAMQRQALSKGKLASIYIPRNFSDAIQANTGSVTKSILHEFGMVDDSVFVRKKAERIRIYFDPVLQENFQYTLVSNLETVIAGLENKVILDQLFVEMGYDEIPPHIAKQLVGGGSKVVAKQATLDHNQKLIPNSSQHNVPAWSIFAMFFMVVSLGGSIVKERLSGSFVRLLTISHSITFALWSKTIVYICVAIIQLALLFSIGTIIFPLIGLPQLQIPDAPIQLSVISLLSAIAAVSYAVLIGTYASTQEQANGFGAVSIVIFAAIGGIWVPTFIMPDYMQFIAKFSPLYWCLDGYYALFLKNGDWNALSSSLIFLSLFIMICQTFTYIKLKSQNYL